MPGKSIEEVKKQNPKFETLKEDGQTKLLRFKLKKSEYILEIYTQVKKENIADLYVRLPQYFLHDLFLKDLQTKFKKQDKFVRHDKSALYVWYNREGNNILYHGSCSITCFPMFIEFVNPDPSIIPLYKVFNQALPKW